MKLTLLSLIFICLSWSANAQDYSRLKVFVTNDQLIKLGNLGVTVDHGIRKEGSFFISDFSSAERAIMDQYEFDYEVLIEDVEQYYIDILNHPEKQESGLKNASCASTSGSGSIYANPATPTNFNLGTMGGYLKYNEMLAELDAMVQQYPNLITAKAPISSFVTHENRPIYHVKISDNPNVNETEPKVLYTAIHHAREPMSLMETIFFMWYVLENYGTNEEITYLVNETQLFFVPCINPDGYVYNETTNPNGGGMWRKNRRNNGGGVYGVDLNRNYGYGWGTTGTSTNTSNDTYCGTAPYSEPEVQAMRWLVQNHNFVTAFNAHTYAEDILFPIGTTVAEFADHHDYFQAHTDHMVEFNGYTSMKSSALYPASGDSDDYMYKMDIGVGVKDTIFVHTPEVGTAFWQPSSEIIATCKEMVFPNLILAHITRNYVVVKDTDPMNISTLSGDFNHSANRLGRMSGPVTVSLQPLLNVASVGSPIVYNMNLMQTQAGAISYTLNPAIQFGDEIKYIVKTDNGLWVKRDTIIKTFGAYNLQVTENASVSSNWTGNWNTTTSTFVSSPRCFTDSPSGNYVNNANTTYSYVPTIDLSNAYAAKISFYAKWNIEADYDYVQFQVSTDGGSTWIGQCGNYTNAGTSANGSVQPNNQPVYDGIMTNWVLEEINLSDYLGQVIKVRFQLRSDNATRKDGFYFDDFSIFYNNQGPAVSPTAQFNTTGSVVCSGMFTDFDDASLDNPTSWSWNFGDGGTSNVQNPTHIFMNAGTYTVQLTVSNAAGSNTTTQIITVNQSPNVVISTSDTDGVICLLDGMITLLSDQNGTAFSGSGVIGSSFDPTVAGIGLHMVTASYTDGVGCVASATMSILVEDCASINELAANGLYVFPNPNQGSFTLQGLELGMRYAVYDVNGKLILEGISNQTNELIQLPRMTSGIYYIQSMKDGQLGQLKFAVLN
ncbi:MAG: M14 family zinc carboxypeptidase [Crocinitomicaceae bacterium]|jgi:carboxypeptidase T|nr:M14 family zinc carboxypeptidase [Crocinitomicaceae bacterium]MDP4761965.1 M14 family zinc carboxypeptidase [Crocinitomicaceae bacterium]